MYTLGPDEKLTSVMIYSNNSLVRGNVVTRENVRVSIWLRTQGMPNYIHILNPQMLLFGGAVPKSFSYDEMFFPTPQVIGFHIVPPAADPMDFDANEAGRRMVDITMMIGTFVLRGKSRISSQTDFATSIDVSRSAWMSFYEADISNPFLPQMTAIHVPMLLVRPDQASFAM